MPSSLTDLQTFWKTLPLPAGTRFNADEAISLVLVRLHHYEAVLEQIAEGKAGPEAARAALQDRVPALR